jgi:hypothetical protein
MDKMTKIEFKKLKLIIDNYLGQAINEASQNGVDITTPDFELILEALKSKLLEERGFTLEEYEELEMDESPTPLKLEGISQIKGDQGIQGDRGEVGERGESVVGPKGEKGERGDDGRDGMNGKDGANGRDGNDGLQGPQGSVGPQGAKGEKGDIGFFSEEENKRLQWQFHKIEEHAIKVGSLAGDLENRLRAGQVDIPGVGSQGTQGPQGPQGTNGIIGVDGAQGPQGPQGSSTGSQGPQGYQGPQGTQGGQGTMYPWKGEWSDATTYAINDCVYYSGSGYVSLQALGNQNPGTQSAAWSLLVQRGPQGTQGFQGVQGPQGPQGQNGILGSQGTQGYQGPQGVAGSGSQGSQGFQGPQGPQGIIGPQGSQGPQGTQGYQGPQGIIGTQGSQGYQGTVGAQGTQGYQGPQGVAGSGAQGSQGFQGPQGPQGVAGSGSQGSQGFQGPQGPQGIIGTQGSQGYQGPVGSQGTQGFQGPQGTVGSQGTQGFQGPQGGKVPGQIFLSSAGGLPETTSACAAVQFETTTNKVNGYFLNFVDAENNYADWPLVMPSDWDAGAVSAYFYWTSSAYSDTAANNGVAWTLAGRSFADDDTLDAAWPAYASASDYGATNYDLYVASAVACTVSGAGANELVIYRAGRMPGAAADTLTAAASLLGIRIDYGRQ